ncbi:hypothetical protein NK718_00565 [Alsobacter sp. SYSU M60028]|uniref:Glutamine amidotransferase domain-containing protein n=1 Tax=Alsobacter ponti TaxID=2962936 RepID=A0ABT1L7R1_9HYPH|nr:hypothetical protein [Alsobacter ponti]MCP8936996.1 hypothetical protein [Alsobacter ponti]
MSLDWSPLLPLPVLVPLALLGVLAAGLALAVRQTGSVLRALAVAFFIAALFNPSFVREERERLKDVVAVVVDRSASQTLDKRAAQTDAVAAAVQSRLAALPDVETRTIEVGETSGGGEGTRLFSALQSGLADVPPDRMGGAILITDGVIHDIPEAAEALGFHAPVHGLITGHTAERDRRIALLDTPRFGIVGKDQTIRLRIDDPGFTDAVKVTVSRDGQRVLERRALPGEVLRLPVRIDHGGANVVEVEAETAQGELTTFNNKAVIPIEGIREKLRVLLVSGQPHAGERTWRNILKSDANVDLVHFTILRPPEKQDGTPISELSLIAFPTRELFETKISEFDLIIFDRYANQSILPSIYFSNIARYVRDGGAVLVSAGPEFAGRSGLSGTPLGVVIPAQPDGRIVERAYLPQVTLTGQRHPVTRALPGSEGEQPQWGEWLRQISATVRTGSTVMQGADDKPLLVLSREGKGRVALLLSDQTWLWARNYRGGGPHLDLLRRLGHWLMKEPDLEEEALRAAARGNTVTITRQSLADEVAPVTYTGPSGAAKTVNLAAASPGLWEANFDATETGLYRLTDGKLTAFVSVGPPNPREYQEVLSTTAALTPLAEATGGSVRRVATRPDDTPRVPSIVALGGASRFSGSDYIGIRRTDASVVRGVGVVPVFLGFMGLLLLAASLLAAWLGEARLGRVNRG